MKQNKKKHPLRGKTVLLTRPKRQAMKTATQLRRLGAKVVVKPMVKIIEKKLSKRDFEEVLNSDCIVFTSQNAAEIFLRQFPSKTKLRLIKFAAIGNATRDIICKYGFKVDYVPDHFTTKEFGKYLTRKLKKNSVVFYPCADRYNREFVRKLKKAGLKIKIRVVYKLRHLIYKNLRLDNIDYVIFSNSMGVESFFKSIRNSQFSNVKFICIGPVTAQKLRSYGYKYVKPAEISFTSVIKSFVFEERVCDQVK